MVGYQVSYRKSEAYKASKARYQQSEKGKATQARHAHSEERKAVILRYQRRARQRAIAILGGKCVRCGFNDWRALQIDHINGGGNQEIKQIGATGILGKVLRGETEDYQLLCANCNWIKRYEEGEASGPGHREII